MKKKSDILNSELKNLEKIYLLTGNNYLIDDFIKKFKDKFIVQQISEFNFETITEKNTDNFIDKLINSISLLPLQSEKRIVITYLSSITENSPLIKRIDQVLNKLSDKTVLFLINYGNLNKRRKYLKKIIDVASIIEFKDLKYKNLSNWIKKKVTSEDKKIEKDAIKLLEGSFNNNLHRLDNELEKIIIFIDNKDLISKTDVREIISKDLYLEENVIFEFVDAIGRKNSSKALILLNEILIQNKNPKHLLIMIERQFRLIIQIKTLYKKGYNSKEIAKKINEHPYPVKKCLKQSNNFSLANLKQAFDFLHKTDIKLVSKGNSELEMELLVLNLVNLS